MTSNTQKGTIVMPIIVFALFLSLGFFSIWYFYNSPNKKLTQKTISTSPKAIVEQDEPQLKTPAPTDNSIYKSDSMNISFLPPNGYKLMEKFNTITLKKDSIIKITAHGSFYNNVNEHIRDHEKKNNFTYLKKDEYTTNLNYKFIRTESPDPKDKSKTLISYFGVHNYGVVTISSSDKETEEDMKSIINSLEFIDD